MDIQITKDNGEIVSREYLRKRVVSGLSKWRRIYSATDRRNAIANTVDDDAWLKRHNHETVGSVIRAVERCI